MDDTLENLTVASQEQFNTALTRLLMVAESSDVDVTGAWECPNDGEPTDWEVVVSELLKEGE